MSDELNSNIDEKSEEIKSLDSSVITPEKQEILELKNEHKKIILDRWNDKTKNPPSIRELVDLCCPGENLDGRGSFAKLVKKYLGTLGLEKELRNASVYQRKSDEIVLTEEQKTFLLNNCPPMTTVEAARVLGNDNTIHNRHILSIAINNFLKLQNKTVQAFDNSIVKEKDYKPPKTQEDCIKKIQKYSRNTIDKENLSIADKRNVDALISHLHNLRFINQMSALSKQLDRDLMESTFVRQVFNKADSISPEEVDIYTILSYESVNEAGIKKTIEGLRGMLDDVIQNTDENEKKKISMGLVESINSLQSEYNSSIKRQKDLLSDVHGKRSERIKNSIAEKRSLVQLFDFAKQQDSRDQMLQLAEIRKKKLKDEIKRIESLDDLVIQVWGISEQELLGE